MADWIAVGISILALGVSFWTAKEQGKYQRQQTEIQKQVANIELKRDAEREEELRHARVTAEFAIVTSGYRPSEVLKVTNHGPAVATEVEVLFEGEEEPYGPLVSAPGELPIKRMLAGQTISLLAAFHMQCAPPFDAILKWTEPNGAKKSEQIRLGRPD